MDTTTPPISEQLRRIIRESPVTQAVLARAIGTTKGTISRFMSGHSVSLDVLDKMGTFLNVQLTAQGEVRTTEHVQPIGRPSRARKLAELLESLPPQEKMSITEDRLIHVFRSVFGDPVTIDLVRDALQQFREKSDDESSSKK